MNILICLWNHYTLKLHTVSTFLIAVVLIAVVIRHSQKIFQKQ